MKGLSLTMKEKYRMIRKVQSGKLSIDRCCILLGLSKKRVRQLIEISQHQDLSGFSHKSKDSIPHNKANSALTSHIIALYSDKYAGFNFKHFQEKLAVDEQIIVSYGFLYNTLSQAGFVSPKANRKKKKPSFIPLVNENLSLASSFRWMLLFTSGSAHINPFFMPLLMMLQVRLLVLISTLRKH